MEAGTDYRFMWPASQGRPAFTLLELLLVVLIATIGIGLLVIALDSHRWSETDYSSGLTRSNLKAMTLAVQFYDDSFGRLPPAFDFINAFPKPPQAHSIHIHLLPFVEHQPVYNDILRGEAKNEAVIPPYFAPIDPSTKGNGGGVQNFAANLRVFSDKGFDTAFNAPLPPLARIESCKGSLKRSFPDGVSNTVLFTTKYSECGQGGSRFAADPTSAHAAFFGQAPATRSAHASDAGATYQLVPTAEQCRPSPLMAQSYWKDAIWVALADGTIRQVSKNVSAEIWNRVLQPNDGLNLRGDWND